MVLQDVNFLELIITITPVLAFIVGMVIYSVFIFKFYKFLAKRDVFELDLRKYNRSKHKVLSKFFSIVLYLIEYILFFPFLVFFWFLVLTVFLSFLAENQVTQSILMISIALVGAVRVTSYYNEDLSKDLAKMLPFALLGVFLVDLNGFSFSAAIDKIYLIPTMSEILAYYFVLIIILEFILRLLHFLIDPFSPVKSEEED